MSRINRYKFIKRMYPEYLIVFETNSWYKYEGIDLISGQFSLNSDNH